MDADILYYERQRTPWYWFLFMAVLNIPFVYGLVKQLILNKPWGNNPMSDTGLIILAAFIFLFSAFMLIIKQEIIITKQGVFTRLFPLKTKPKLYSWEKIDKAAIKKYSLLQNRFGWGFKIGMNGSTTFNMRGNIGLELILNNGHKVIIGTFNPQELEKVIAKFKK